MSFSDKQQEFFMNATHRWNVKTGATRSGKTYMDYFVIPKRIRACTGDGLIVFIGNTQSTLERNLFDPMRKMWGNAFVGHVRQNENKIRLFGRECYALGADKANAAHKLQGSGIEYCYGDEITTWSEPVFQMLKSRLDKPNSVFDGTCNPDNPQHWFHKFLQSDADIYYQHYTIDDNPYLTPAFVDSLKKEYAGTVYYDRYIRGLWTRAEGLIYDMFSRERHVIDKPDDRYRKYYVSIDYGTQNPTVFLLFGQTMNGDKWHLIKEYYYSGREKNRQKTDSEFCTDLIDFIGETRVSGVIVDPSAASFIAEMRKRGIKPIKADNNVLDGIRRNCSQLEKDLIKICSCCVRTIEEFESYSWDMKAADRGEDAPIKENDHAMDAWRYFTNTALYRNNKIITIDKRLLGF